MNVDVEDEGDGSDQPEIKTIRIVNSENEEKFMYEMCSTILKSAAALARHKMSIHGMMMMTNMCVQIVELLLRLKRNLTIVVQIVLHNI